MDSAVTRTVSFGDFVQYDTTTEKTRFSQKIHSASEWILNCTGRTVYYISPSAVKNEVTALEEISSRSKSKQFFSSVGKIAFVALLTIGSIGIIPISALITKAICRHKLGTIQITPSSLKDLSHINNENEKEVENETEEEIKDELDPILKGLNPDGSINDKQQVPQDPSLTNSSFNSTGSGISSTPETLVPPSGIQNPPEEEKEEEIKDSDKEEKIETIVSGNIIITSNGSGINSIPETLVPPSGIQNPPEEEKQEEKIQTIVNGTTTTTSNVTEPNS